MMIEIRPFSARDLAASCAIYNHYVEKSIATFDLQPRSIEAFASGFLAPPNLGLVAVDDDDLLGFASLGPFIHRKAAAQTMEIALYLRADSCGRGLGPRLLEAAHEAARTAHLTSIIAVITRENPGSCAFFERHGYAFAGSLTGIARKFDKDLGVSYYQVFLS